MNTYISTIKSICNNSKYTIWYCEIIQNALLRSVHMSYVEKHHILPKCFNLGGDKDPHNIAVLTAKEHFICHLLLPKMVEDKILKGKLAYAAFQMTWIAGRDRYKVCSNLYRLLKEQLSLNTKNVPKSDVHKAKLRKPKSTTINMKKPKSVPNWNKGGSISNETKAKQSAAMKGRYVGELNSFYGQTHSQETIEYLRSINLGKILTEEHKQNISKSLKGKEPWNKGIPASQLHKENVSKGLVGQIIITNGIENKRIQPSELENYDPNIWHRGKTTRPIPKLQGTIFINDGNITKRIKPEDLHLYDPATWKRGQIKRAQ